MADAFAELIELHALGLLEGDERTRLQAHLDEPCRDCHDELARSQEALGALAAAAGPAVPAPALRGHVLELADLPRGAVDLRAYQWDEVLPGVRMCLLGEDAAAGVRKVLVWADPGARYPSHRHLGEEEIYVLQGRLRDHRGEYGPGQVCRSLAGSVHSEEAVPGEDCVCYVVYHGGHEAVEE